MRRRRGVASTDNGINGFCNGFFSGYPYAQVAVAAFLPAVLYFFSLYVQIDSYAGREGLKGIDEDKIPQLISFLDRAGIIWAPLVFLYFYCLCYSKKRLLLITPLWH